MILVAMGLLANPVIAAPGTPDQDVTSVPVSSTVQWLDWWPVPVGLAALLVFLWLPDRRLQNPRLRQWSYAPAAGLFFFVAILLGGLLGQQVAWSLLGLTPEQMESIDMRSMFLLMLGNYVGQGVVLLLVPGLAFRRAVAANPGRPPMTWWRSGAVGVGSLVLFWPLVLGGALLTGLVVSLVTGQPLPEIAHGTLEQLQSQERFGGWMIAVIALIVLAAPMWEEAVYRGLLQESIRRHPLLASSSPWVAVLLTSNVFTLVHASVVDVRGLAGLFILSLGFGWVFLRTGRLLAGIVMHSAFNVFNLLLVL